MKVWMDGELRDTADATVSVFDHGLLYGDGVFEGIRIYGGRIFRAEDHVTRLFQSARAIRLEIPHDTDRIIAAMYETLQANSLEDGYIRLVVTRGAGTLGLNPFECPEPHLFVIADTIQLYPQEMYDNGMRVITSSVVRNNPNALSPRIKSLNYLNNILAKIEAIDAGVPEAIMLNANGLVAEATGDNIFIVRNGTIITPPLHAGVLEGVTRGVVAELAEAAALPLVESELTRHDLYIADECFLTGTAAEIIAVTDIDGRRVGQGEVGPITRRLTKAFRTLVRTDHRD